MPIYEYGCQRCGKKTEAIQRFGEKHLKICPHCGGALKKLASAPAIQFKGSGFYITDYPRAKKEGKTGSSEKGETSEKSQEKSGEKTGEKSGEKAGEKAGEKKKDTKEKKTKD